MRIAGLDPGKQRDSFAFVGTEIRDRSLYIITAKRWLGRAYIDVEKEINQSHKKNPYDKYVVERNNTGEHVVEILSRGYHLPVWPVVTGKELKSKDKIYSPKIMDKNEMVKYMIILGGEGRLIYPANKSDEMKELQRQMAIFAEHKTEAGKFTYFAEGNEHDDLVMALMLACFVARYYINRKASRATYGAASRSFTTQDEDLLGSGVPEEYQTLGRAVWTP